jgi:hypothetical protein
MEAGVDRARVKKHAAPGAASSVPFTRERRSAESIRLRLCISAED